MYFPLVLGQAPSARLLARWANRDGEASPLRPCAVPIFKSDRQCVLGTGGEAFQLAAHALLTWRMFDIDWLRLIRPEADATAGQVYGVGYRCLGLWLVGVARWHRVRATRDRLRSRQTVSCRTAMRHAVVGGEFFSVVLDVPTSRVVYRIRSCSQVVPALRPLTGVVRATQRRFVRDSCLAMQRAVAETLLAPPR